VHTQRLKSLLHEFDLGELELSSLGADAEAGPQRLFAIFDGAQDPSLVAEIEQGEHERHCLFDGKLTPALAAAAPWIVDLGQGRSSFTEWVVGDGWGAQWGIYLTSRQPLSVLRRHFRTFLRVKKEDGTRLFFRYYDPRVLRLYLPTCNSQELDTVFGPVEAFLVEDADPAFLLCFARGGDGELTSERRHMDRDALEPKDCT
jgi:hypothetical protein